MSDLPETITIRTAVQNEVIGTAGAIVGHVNGGLRVDASGQLVLHLGLREGANYREIETVEGDSFAFGGVSWIVSKVFEPQAAAESEHWAEATTGGGGLVAVLTQVVD